MKYVCLFWGNGIALTLADVNPPDILNRASALAVDTLDLVLADDGILERSTVLEEENGIGVTSLFLTGAADTTAIGLHATIESARDALSLLVGDATLGGRNRESSPLLEGVEEVGRGHVNSRGGIDGGHEGKDGGSSSELHCGGCWVGRMN